MTLTNEQIKSMPKVELHLHLDGSILPKTLIELAKQQNKQAPADGLEQLNTLMSAPEDCTDLNQYLSTFDVVLPYMQTVEALERVAYELVHQSAEQNVKYVEVRFAPQLHTKEGLTVNEIYEAVIRGLKRGETEYKTISRCIGICLRGHSAEQNMEVVEAAATYFNNGLVAVDLAGAEALYPPELYEAHFSRAAELGLPITIHAGEAGGADNIATSVHLLHASRIGHGIRLQEDQELLVEIKKQQIPLECCPISNIQTKATNSWSEYPLRAYLAQGIKVTVNTDNLTVSQTNLTKEFVMLQEKCGLTKEEMIQLQKNAADAIFLEQPTKQHFIESFYAELVDWAQSIG